MVKEIRYFIHNIPKSKIINLHCIAVLCGSGSSSTSRMSKRQRLNPVITGTECQQSCRAEWRDEDTKRNVATDTAAVRQEAPRTITTVRGGTRKTQQKKVRKRLVVFKYDYIVDFKNLSISNLYLSFFLISNSSSIFLHTESFLSHWLWMSRVFYCPGRALSMIDIETIIFCSRICMFICLICFVLFLVLK